MASFWTKIFPKTLCEKLKIRVSELLHVKTTKIVHDESQTQNITINGDVLLINTAGKITRSEQRAVYKLVRTLQQNAGSVLLEETRERFDELQAVESDATTQKLEDYFRPILSSSDMRIFRACCLLRRRHESGGSVDALKQDIVRTYGPRGRSLANLCTAKYFENWFKPLYEALQKRNPETAVTDFQRIYDDIVEKLPWTIFVPRNLSAEDVAEQVVARLLTYRMGFVLVHGLGAANTATIRDVCDIVRSQYPEIKNSDISSQEDISRMCVRFQL